MSGLSRGRPKSKNCEQCGSSFAPDRIGSRFCSPACFGLSRVMPRDPCEQCGGPMRDRKKSGRRFCSKACEAKARTIRVPHGCSICGVPVTYEATTCPRHNHTPKRIARQRACKECGTKFVPYPSALLRSAGAFCSRACFAAQQARRPQFVTASCSVCHEPFERTLAALKRTDRPVCSRECQALQQQGAGNVRWRGGVQRGYRGPGWVKRAAAIRDRDGHRCRWCGEPEPVDGRAHAVDHVLPYRSFDDKNEANHESNLVTLCHRCHGRKSRAEDKWWRGDVLDMWRYQVAVAQPWVDR